MFNRRKRWSYQPLLPEADASFWVQWMVQCKWIELDWIELNLQRVGKWHWMGVEVAHFTLNQDKLESVTV